MEEGSISRGRSSSFGRIAVVLSSPGTRSTSVRTGPSQVMSSAGSGGLAQTTGRGTKNGRRTGGPDARGRDLQKVNAAFARGGPALIEAGAPLAVYSTKTTKTEKDRPTGQDPAIPGGIAAVPEDHVFGITSGEVLVGMFEDAKKRTIAAFTSHKANATAGT